MNNEDEEFNRIEREATLRLKAVSAALKDHRDYLLKRMSEYERGVIDGRQMQVQSSVDKAVNAMARPSAPDVLTASEGETADYVQGWNDCREAMLRGVKP
jgi:hypothetical protein